MVDMAICGRIAGAVFGDRQNSPLLHRDGLPDMALPRGVLFRRPVLDQGGGATGLNSFEVAFTYPTGDLTGRKAQQGDEVTDTSGRRRRVLSARPDDGGMTSLILEE